MYYSLLYIYQINLWFWSFKVTLSDYVMFDQSVVTCDSQEKCQEGATQDRADTMNRTLFFFCIKTVFQVSEWENIPRIFRLECILHQESQQFLHLYAYVPILKEFLLSQGLGHKQRRKCDYQDSYTSHSLSLGI